MFLFGIFINKITITILILVILIFALPESMAERIPQVPEIRSATQTGLNWAKEKFSQVFELSKKAFRKIYSWVLVAGEFIKNAINGAYEATRGAVVGTLEDAFEVFDKARRIKSIVDE
jgi:hypothetical protein